MTWEVLHSGKFVDGHGVVLERAEHEFLARSAGFLESAVRLIARDDPVARAGLVPWSLSVDVEAGFVQTSVRLDGEDWTLRVIDHRAHEGGGAGRPYRKRTYLMRRCDDWGADDARLPTDLVADPPQFQERSDVAPWSPPGDGPLAWDDLASDLDALLDAGRAAVPAPLDEDAVRRVEALLAAFPPGVAARLDVRLVAAGEGQVVVGEGTAPTGSGHDLLHVWKARGAKATLRGVHGAAQTESIAGAFDRVRADLTWLARSQAWALRAAAALKRGRAPPATPEASPRMARVAMAVLEPDGWGHLDVVAGEGWPAAWAQVEADGPWAAVAALLAGRTGPQHLASLAGLPLDGDVARRAMDAWNGHLDAAGDALQALIMSRAPWADAWRKANRDRVVDAAFAHVGPGGLARHAITRWKEGKALLALLAGEVPTAPQEATLRALAGRPAAARLVAQTGRPEALAAWSRIGGRLPEPDDAPAPWDRVLRIAHGQPVAQADAAVGDLLAADVPLDVVRAFDAGLSVQALESILADQPAQVRADDPDVAVWRLVGRCTTSAWIARFGDAPPWNALAGGAGIDLERVPPRHAIGFAAVGLEAPAVARVEAADVARWCRQGPPEALHAFVAAGGDPRVALAGLEAARKADALPEGGDATMLADALKQDLGWWARRRALALGRRLEAE